MIFTDVPLILVRPKVLGGQSVIRVKFRIGRFSDPVINPSFNEIRRVETDSRGPIAAVHRESRVDDVAP